MHHKFFHRFTSQSLLFGMILILTACAQSNVSPTPMPALLPSPTSTVAPICPNETEGTKLLRNDEMGFCLLYPESYMEVATDTTQICLVPGDSSMACHSANAFINVESAAGRTSSQVADQIIAEASLPEMVSRTGLKIDGEEAVMLDGLGGVDINRKIVIVHGDRLYTLMFTPWDSTRDEWARVEDLHDIIVNSFIFLP